MQVAISCFLQSFYVYSLELYEKEELCLLCLWFLSNESTGNRVIPWVTAPDWQYFWLLLLLKLSQIWPLGAPSAGSLCTSDMSLSLWEHFFDVWHPTILLEYLHYLSPGINGLSGERQFLLLENGFRNWELVAHCSWSVIALRPVKEQSCFLIHTWKLTRVTYTIHVHMELPVSVPRTPSLYWHINSSPIPEVHSSFPRICISFFRQRETCLSFSTTYWRICSILVYG